ncbi:enterochelin esterase [Saccharospirillum sp. MSK14-1]|uniref:enterochelin esterase n=1 Tax=Saccharospirillum sp. MSK14-1 TaxID=1897632 RepID=UPI000D4C0A31|nr:enterochelin esterase [Saccharospirillum sp. MSK14-1]PTY38694.1 enterochelin esterase [Saccharospirillum sp. MSK14-1]
MSVVGPETETALPDDWGSPQWWALLEEVGTPWVEKLSATDAKVSFFWRDPEGGPERSSTRTVLIDVNAVTDHHSVEPAVMRRYQATDVWVWQTVLPLDWRGSYVFAPHRSDLTVPDYQGSRHEKRLQHRRWWLDKITRTGRADPLNHWPSHLSSWGVQHSALHMPKALPQPDWQAFDCAQAVTPAESQWQQQRWHSQRLGNERSIWIYDTGGNEERPLVLLLDGQHWANHFPVYSALSSATAVGKIPAALYVLIDSIDLEQRQNDLGCSEAFWLAIQEELLPKIQADYSFTSRPERTVVCGQSLGGLSALYANLRWPERFGAALAQSPSLWWPDRDWVAPDFGEPRRRQAGATGWLTEQTRLQPSTGRIFMEVGTGEASMVDLLDSHTQALVDCGYEVHSRHYAGGHDWLCWRGGIIDGLIQLIGEEAP